MKDEEQIRELLYRFEYSGLITKNKDDFLNCFGKQVLGIGIGEQGFVTSIKLLEEIYNEILKEEDALTHTLDFGRMEVLLVSETVGVICAEVVVYSCGHLEGAKQSKSEFQQSLTVIKEQGEWKVCGFHASTPFVTEESMEALPVKFAEHTLQNLREKIGEETYLAEEQYRKAILSDTIAFYIVNFTKNCFEKCQLDSEDCLYVDADMPYEEFVNDNTPKYVFEGDQEMFIETFSIQNVQKAYENHQNELSCEYRMKSIDGTLFWARTIIRLITDVITQDKKGILYVKNIEHDRRAVQEIMQKADYDGMTGTLNKRAIVREVNDIMLEEGYHGGGTFLMVDVDDFKGVNDTFGHPVGDLVLTTLAGMLRKFMKPEALIGRLGGDEFGIFFPGMFGEREVSAYTKRLLKEVERFALPEENVKISISIGGIALPSGCFAELYKLADDALYQAKKNGKNQLVWGKIQS